MFLTLDGSTKTDRYEPKHERLPFSDLLTRPPEPKTHRRCCFTCRIQSNSGELQSTVEEIHNSKKALEEELRTKAVAHMEVDKKISGLKTDVVQLRKIRDQYLL